MSSSLPTRSLVDELHAQALRLISDFFCLIFYNDVVLSPILVLRQFISFLASFIRILWKIWTLMTMLLILVENQRANNQDPSFKLISSKRQSNCCHAKENLAILCSGYDIN